LSATGVGISYTTGVINSNATSTGVVADTIVSRGVDGAVEFGDVKSGILVIESDSPISGFVNFSLDTAATDGGFNFATKGTGVFVVSGSASVTGDLDVSSGLVNAGTLNANDLVGTDTFVFANGGTLFTHSSPNPPVIDIATGDVTFSGQVKTLQPSPIADEDLVNKLYVDSLVTGGVANVARVTYTAFTFAAQGSSVTIQNGFTGRVHRIKVYIDTAFDGTTPTVQVGDDTVNGRIAAVADSDATVPGVYVVELNQNYGSAEDIKIFVGGADATAGAGSVIVEYLG
jgi:hypothetical protein